MYHQPVLHSIRSLLCIITKVTHRRRSFNGYSSPTFLTQPSLVLIKKYLRHTIKHSAVLKVELIQANSDFMCM